MKHQITGNWRASLALIISFGFASLAAAATTADQNWPEWRGPLRNGVAPSANPPVTWSETNNVKWKVKIPGGGSATPIIWDNLVFVQTAIPTGKKVEPAPTGSQAGDPPAASAGAPTPPPHDGTNGSPSHPPGGGQGGGRGGFRFAQKPTELYQFAVLCLDRKTGKILWQQVAREEVPHEGVMQNEGSYASPSGLTDGRRVFAYFGSRGLYCYDLAGNPQWNQDLGKMRIAMSFGEGSSPTLYKDTLIINWDNEAGSFITALNKNTGKTLWKESRNEHTSWSTPIVVEYDDKPQVITTATGKIRSYDLSTGKMIWECGGLTRNVIPSPVADATTVYCMSGFMGNSLLAIRLGHTGDLTDTDAVAWTHKKSTPYVPSPLLYGDKLYFYANNNAVLSCLNTKSGEPLFDAERVEGLANVYASPVGASGRIYLAGRNGTTVILKESEKYEVLATNQLDEKFDASPAAVGKELFLRGRESLYCIAEK
jgi:outer membrane protein assembly factor BamB